MRRQPLSAIALLLTVLLTACGGARNAAVEEAGPVDLSDAIAATQSAGSARVTMTAESTTGTFSFGMLGEGRVLLDGSRGVFTLSMTGDFAGIEPSEIRIVDGVQYLSGGMAQHHLTTGTAPEGTEWVATPVPEFGFVMPSSGMGDIGSQLELLRAADARIEELPDTELDGTSYHRVRALLTLGQQLEALDVSIDEMFATPPGTEPVFDQAGADAIVEAAADVSYRYEVLYADDGLVRRITTTADLGPIFAALAELAPGGVQPDLEASMTMQMDFTDYGVEVDVEAPTENVHHLG